MDQPLTDERRVFPGPVETSRALAGRLGELAHAAVRGRGRFALALSGGSTPVGLYGLLAGEYAPRIPWGKVEVGFVDERAVAPDDPRSNFGLVRRTLLEPLERPLARVERIEGELRPLEVARDRYERTLREMFETSSGAPEAPPSFDAVLLGVGADGHTASLFPGAGTLSESSRWVTVERQPALDPRVERITLTLPALATSRRVIFLVLGESKRPTVERLFRDPHRGTPEGELPAARVRAREGVEWYLDAAAAPETSRRGRK